VTDRLAELEAFLKAVEHGTLSGAARALDRSPSAMSKLIQRLENRLQVRLINRTSRALSLTPEGEMLYREGQKTLDAFSNMERDVSSRSPEVSGILRVGSSIQIAQYYLSPLIPRIRELYPHLELHFVLRGAPFSLVEHQIDVAVFSGEQASSSYVARRVLPVHWIVCAAPAYLQRAGVPSHPSDLEKHECLVFLPEATGPWPFTVDGEVFPVNPTGMLRANSVQLLRTFALLGLGIVRIPIAQVQRELSSNLLVPLLQQFEEPTPDWIYALYQSARNLSPRVVAFLRMLDSEFRVDEIEPANASLPRL